MRETILRMVGVSGRKKPYRVYRQRRRHPGGGQIDWDAVGAPARGSQRRTPRPGSPKPPSRKRRPFWRWIRRLILVVLLVVLVWAVVAFVAFRQAVEKSNDRVPDDVLAALSPTDGPAWTTPRNTLVLGSDVGEARRKDAPDDPGRSDTMMLVRTDPAGRRLSMLNLPRDLRVEVPGYGEEKLNAAYSLGGPALTIRTVKKLTGLPVHHYMEVDFDGFRGLIDEIGGVTIDNPYAIRSNSFDGYEWEFNKGTIELDGRRALAYTRVRGNQLNTGPAGGESDFTRGQRQQRVVAAIADSFVDPATLLHPMGVPRAAVRPLTTDAAANALVAFGFTNMWAKEENKVRCRLGGDIGSVDGVSYIIGNEENKATIRMFLGRQPPVQPDLRVNPFAPGCLER